MGRSSILVLSLLHLLHLTMLVESSIIDTHSHYVPPFYKASLDPFSAAIGFPIPAWNASAHLEFQDQFGITTSILSVSTPGAKLSPQSPIEEGRELARQLNEYGKDLTIEYPNRFLFFASLTLPDLEGAVAEAIYALDTLGAAGVVVYGSKFGELMGTPRYAPLYKVLDDRNAIVFIHPGDNPCSPPPDSPCSPPPVRTPDATDLPTYVVDFLLDTTRAAINLVYRNVTTDYPNINFLLAHSGGVLSFAGLRAAGTLAGSIANMPSFLKQERDHFHVDLAISANPFALPSTMAFFNNEHITFGTDYPYAPVPVIKQNIANLLAYPMTDGVRKRIDHTNAYALMEKFLTGQSSCI